MTKKSGWSPEKRLAKTISKVGLDEAGERPIYGRCLEVAKGIGGCAPKDREVVAAEQYLMHADWLHGRSDKHGPFIRQTRAGEVGFAGLTAYKCPKHGDVISCSCRPVRLAPRG